MPTVSAGPFNSRENVGKARISVPLAPVNLAPVSGSRRLKLTALAVFLAGHAPPAQREHGTGAPLDALAAELRRQATPG